jgi:hypothetical protein
MFFVKNLKINIYELETYRFNIHYYSVAATGGMISVQELVIIRFTNP